MTSSSADILKDIDYEEGITDLMSRVTEGSSRKIALDMWKHYPKEAMMLLCALEQTRHTDVRIPRLFERK